MVAINDGPGALAGALGAGEFVAGQQQCAVYHTSHRAASALRSYQRSVFERVWHAIDTATRRILLVLPTGAGKTVVAAAVIREAVARGMRVLVLSHRREITGQTSRKLYAAGVDHGIIAAGFPLRLGERVQLASVQTVYARAVRTASIELPEADLIVVDETHHVRARTYRRILAEYPNAIVIGLTATPCRGDGRGLGTAFNTLIEGADIAELTAAGYLVPARVYAPSRPDLAGVRVERGDYVEKQLAAAVDRPQLVGDIVEHWLRLAERRATVVFATGVAHSVHVRDEFRRHGVMAEHLDGSTPAEQRDAILAGLAVGRLDVVTNAAVLTEGWDCPEASCLVLARPTKSLGLFRQMVGRVLRPAPGKTDALILDHAGAVFTHGFPDDPINWTLREDRRAENKAQAARVAGRAPSLTECPECRAVRFEGQNCTACGWQPRRKPVAFDIAEGQLGQVNRDRSVIAAEIDRRRFQAMLAYIGNERGYQPGWAAHKFKEKFGAWPASRYVEPIPPDDACRAWVRSRTIAYAKAMQKAGAS